MAEENQILIPIQPNDLNCTICICRYNYPTTLPCGHTFCKDCIQEYWQQNKKCSCPVCQKVFQNPELNKNTDIAFLLDILQAQINIGHLDCPSCTGSEALKLCLPCMAPLCRNHLLLHSEDTAQQRHFLVNLLTEETTWLCRQHDKGLQYFCAVHCSPLCVSCAEDHQTCNPRPLLQLYKTNKDNIQKQIGEMSKDITVKEQDITRMKNAYCEIQILVCDIKDNLTRDFREMRDYIEKQERASFWRIKQEQDAAHRKMLEGITPVIAQITELKKIKAQLEDTVLNNWIEVLRHTIKDTSSDWSSPAMKCDNLFDENRIIDTTDAIAQIKQSLLSHNLLEQNPCPPKQVTEDIVDLQIAPSTSTMHPMVKPSKKSPNHFLQWAYDISFDPETVSNRLLLSSDRKKVTITGKKYPHPKHHRRFTTSQVLCSESFSTDCYYWEINATLCSAWAIGVADFEIGTGHKLGRNNLSWCIEWNKEQLLSSWHGDEQISIRLPKPRIVGVLLDCNEKVVSFYSVTEETQTLLHSYKLCYKMQVLPAVWLYGLETGNSLTINNIKRTVTQ
ncbi:E3 ubiquitin-protein ligase RNF135 [Pelodytes ibericus]